MARRPKPKPARDDETGVYITPMLTAKETDPLIEEYLDSVTWIPPLTDDQIGFDEDDD